ncbi:hypothetical protein EMIT0P218_110103 [Pseudomonas sp. IT-P218]
MVLQAYTLSGEPCRQTVLGHSYRAHAAMPKHLDSTPKAAYGAALALSIIAPDNSSQSRSAPCTTTRTSPSVFCLP